MIVADRSHAAHFDLTDETVAGTRPELAMMLTTVATAPVRRERLTAPPSDVKLAAENRVLAKSLKQVLAVVDQQVVDLALIAELRQRLTRAEETIEDLIAILLTSQSHVAGR